MSLWRAHYIYLGGFSIEDIKGSVCFKKKGVTLIQIDKWIEGNKIYPGMEYILLQNFWEKNRFYCEFCDGKRYDLSGRITPYPPSWQSLYLQGEG